MSRHNTHQTRKAARRKVVQILYQASVTGQSVAEILSEGLYVEEVGVPCDFTKLLLLGTAEHLDEIDALIARTSENWAIDRMPIVDLSVLRMAVFEMKYLDDVPMSVSINEAIDLAKHYGGEDDSSRFVNGVLGKIAVVLEQEEMLESTEGVSQNLQDVAHPEQEK